MHLFSRQKNERIDLDFPWRDSLSLRCAVRPLADGANKLSPRQLAGLSVLPSAFGRS